MIAAVTLALTLAAGFAQPPASPAPIPEPSAAATVPTPSATPVTGPSATAVPAPAATASVAPEPAPTTTATADPYKYRFVPRQPAVHEPGTPQIFAIYLNDQTLHGSGLILIKVVTSPDVVKVITRSNGREGVVQEAAPGDFEANSRLPKIPFIAAGMTTLLEFVALTADGKSVSVKVPVKLE